MPFGPLSYRGAVAIPFINKTFPPSSNNIQFPVPTIWIDTAGKDAWILVSVDLGTAEWVPIGGLPGQVEKVGVDAATAPGTNPVVPNAAQTVIVTGGQTAPATITNVIRSNSLAANTYTIQIQQTSVAAAKNTQLNGVSHFNSTQFINDEGFISIVGGPAVTKFNVDANTAPGTNPVLPDGTGQVTITGAQVAAGVVGANVIRTDSLAANTYTIEIQRSAAVAGTASLNNGVSHFNSTYFTVDANAFVSLTGIASFLWSEVIVVGPTSMVANNGYVTNNAAPVTLTLPVTAAFGTLIRVAGKGAGGWIIAQNGGQNIQVGNVSSTVGVGGSIASTNAFDAIELLCTTANTTWTAISSPVGVLTIT